MPQRRITGETQGDVIACYRELAGRNDLGSFSPDRFSSDETLVERIYWDEATGDWQLDYDTDATTGRDIATLLLALGLIWLAVFLASR